MFVYDSKHNSVIAILISEHASPAERKIFLDEFLSMTKIGQHPNIVMLLGACQHEGKTIHKLYCVSYETKQFINK